MKSVSRGWFGSEMLTRRRATVTISAPEASTAAAFSSRLLYLPVPTIRREVKVRPATVQVSALMSCCAVTSTASDKMHDFILVAVNYLDFSKRGARHDLEIALDGHLRRIDSDLPQHLGDAD